MLSWSEITSRLGHCCQLISPAFSPSHFIGLLKISHKSSLILVSFLFICSNCCTPLNSSSHTNTIYSHTWQACSWIIYVALITSTLKIMREANVSNVGVITSKKSSQATGQDGGKMPQVKKTYLCNVRRNITKIIQSTVLRNSAIQLKLGANIVQWPKKLSFPQFASCSWEKILADWGLNICTAVLSIAFDTRSGQRLCGINQWQLSHLLARNEKVPYFSSQIKKIGLLRGRKLTIYTRGKHYVLQLLGTLVLHHTDMCFAFVSWTQSILQSRGCNI